MTYDEKKPKKQGLTKVSFPFSGMETRISAVADLYESRKQAASTAEAGLSSLQRWIAGDGMPAFDSVALLAAGKGVSLEWIATGKGEMFLDGIIRQPQQDDDVYAYVPLYDARISAGHGSWSAGARILTHLAFTRYSLRKKGLDPANLSAVQIDGDSNEPLLHDGDTVMVDHSRGSVEGEAFYVICLDDHLYAKRLQRQIGGGVAVISANPAYQTMMVAKENLHELQIIGRVVWSAGWMV